MAMSSSSKIPGKTDATPIEGSCAERERLTYAHADSIAPRIMEVPDDDEQRP
jgi:hypothetical protein